eukprot:TRINITY_DN92571_c0_g1_i1.p1 TRINITY_DN92571_c0_g1~~TRINITY_DN92571_c0_g1_i1.p1  ORF type:complete len:368 (-),score=102.58 TRINITY_DN92571_c0_g1_i1:92-1195(-)
MPSLAQVAIGSALAAQHAEAASRCWLDAAAGYTAIACCHPKFGSTGNADCWDAVFSAKDCCNEDTWEPQEVAEFKLRKLNDWIMRCESALAFEEDSTRPAGWLQNLPQELLFWLNYLRDAAKAAAADARHPLARVLQQSSPLDSRLQSLLTTLGATKSVRILDVGSGPFTPLGYIVPGLSIELVAVDPLACAFAEMRRDLGIQVPAMAAPVFSHVEQLEHALGKEAFDVVHCSNALDHSYNPLAGVIQMLRVVKAGKPVLLLHARNVGKLEGYSGLHKWNFDVQNDRFVLWNSSGVPVDVEDALVAEGLILPGSVQVKLIQDRRSGEADTGENEWDKAAVGKIAGAEVAEDARRVDLVEAVLWRRST